MEVYGSKFGIRCQEKKSKFGAQKKVGTTKDVGAETNVGAKKESREAVQHKRSEVSASNTRAYHVFEKKVDALCTRRRRLALNNR